MNTLGKKEIYYPHHITGCDDHLSTHYTNRRDFHVGSRSQFTAENIATILFRAPFRVQAA
jgi:hypothetical protein